MYTLSFFKILMAPVTDLLLFGLKNSWVGIVIFARHFTQARLAQSVEHQTFNLRVKGSSPLLGASFSLFFSCQPMKSDCPR